ncbi:hypothetical protein BHM03_00060567, partial [Ensete ventricosum]
MKHGWFRFDLFRLVREVCTGPTGYRYADCPLPGGTVEIGVSPRGNEAPPRLPAGERGDASSSCAGMRHRLVFPRGDEARRYL